MGCDFNLVTPFTSFIAVEERHPGEEFQRNPAVLELLLQNPVDSWGDADREVWLEVCQFFFFYSAQICL
jgi:hypothetical protein